MDKHHPKTTLERVNDLLDCAALVDGATISARAYLCQFRNLSDRLPLSLGPNQKHGVEVVRAALLRATIGTAIAILDPTDKRGNRASLGHIMDVLNDASVVELLLADVPPRLQDERRNRLAEARKEYATLYASDVARRVRRLRNEAIAHVLRPDTPTPTVETDDVFKLTDDIERLIVSLFDGLWGIAPQFPSIRQPSETYAATFWDTYFAGMTAVANTGGDALPRQ